MQGNDSIKNATSILDYIFRELAVTYLDRFDLAHVDPSQAAFDELGNGEHEGKAPAGHVNSKYMSQRPHPLAPAEVRRDGRRRRWRRHDECRRTLGAQHRPPDRHDVLCGQPRKPPHGSLPPCGEGQGGGHRQAAALAIQPELKLSPTERLEALPFAKPDVKAQAAEKRAEARARGYEGDSCGECGNFTLVRNGTCMKCDTCGSTTGCS